MDNGYVINIPKYNSTTYLYDVEILLNDEVKQKISCYRILNSTPLIYSEEAGYFYISLDSKYLYFKDMIVFNDYLKNIYFSINNPLKTNKEILDINNDPIQKYTYIILSTIPENSCINLALEDNNKDRLNQIINMGIYNSYDCIVKNIKNNTPAKDSIYERLSGISTPSSTGENNITIVDIHQYNKFYVYGLTTLNMLLIVIIVIMLLLITNDGKPKNNKLTFRYIR